MKNSNYPVEGAVYTHYKGALYTVLFVATNSTNASDGRRLVVYRSRTGGEVYARDLEEFIEDVTWSDGVLRPRFVPADAS